MTQSIVVLYKPPADDPAKFEAYYSGTHLPLAGQALAGLVASVETGKVVGSSSYYRFAKLGLPPGKTAEETMATPGMQKVVVDLANFATGGVEVLVVQND